jgi:hypothetical protein
MSNDRSALRFCAVVRLRVLKIYCLKVGSQGLCETMSQMNFHNVMKQLAGANAVSAWQGQALVSR